MEDVEMGLVAREVRLGGVARIICGVAMIWIIVLRLMGVGLSGVSVGCRASCNTKEDWGWGKDVDIWGGLGEMGGCRYFVFVYRLRNLKICKVMNFG